MHKTYFETIFTQKLLANLKLKYWTCLIIDELCNTDTVTEWNWINIELNWSK